MAVIRKSNDIPDILPLMNGQDTSLLYINEDVHKIKSRYRDSNYDSVKSNKSLSLYDPNITGTLKGDEEVTFSHTIYDVTKGTDNVKTTYNDVITPSKFSLNGKTSSGSGNLAHGGQVTANGDIGHHAKEVEQSVGASSPSQSAVSTVSSVAHANPNSMNGDMKAGNNQEPMVNGNTSTEHVEYTSTRISNDGVVRRSSEDRASTSQQSNRNSQSDNVSTERSEVTKGSTAIKKSGSFQIRSSLNSNRESSHSDTSSKGTSIAGSADITTETNGVDEEEQVISNQEIRRHSSGASSKEKQGSRPASRSSNSGPSYMRDTNSSQAKRASRASERSPSVSSDKPPLYRSTSKTSNSGSRPPSGQFTAVRNSPSASKRPDSTSQSPPPSPTKAGAPSRASRSSSARRSEASTMHTSPSASNRNSVVSSRSSSVKRGDSFSRETPPASPTKVSVTPPRTPSFKGNENSVQYPAGSPSKAVSPVRTSSQRSSASRSSSGSREGRPRKPSQDYTSPVRDSSASVAISETSVVRTSARNSVASSVSSKPPSRTPSAAKPPSGANVSRQSSQKRASTSSTSTTPTASGTSTKERTAGKFVMKYAPGSDGGQGDTPVSPVAMETMTFQTSTPQPSTSDNFELSAGLLSSQKAQLKTNGYTPKPRTFTDTDKSMFAAGEDRPAPKFHVDTSHMVGVRTKSSVASPSDIVVSSPTSPMDEMRSTLKSGTVGKLIKDFKSTPLTGRLYDPSSLDRARKKAESPTRKFKFSVEGIDVPASPPPNESPAATSASPVTTIPPGTVPPPPPISPEILNKVASSPALTVTQDSSAPAVQSSATTAAVTTPASAPATTPASPESVPQPPPPPPPPPPDFADDAQMNSLERNSQMNSLERERKRGFTYILDTAVVPEMKKKAESVMARKPHEAVEEQQSKRSSDILHDHEVATLREARAKLNRQVGSPKPGPSPPDYSTATTDADAVIKVSSDMQNSNRSSSNAQNSNRSSSNVQNLNRSSSNVQNSNRSSSNVQNSNRSSSEVQNSRRDSQKSSSDVQRSSTVIQKTTVTTDTQRTGSDLQTNNDIHRSSIVVQKTTTDNEQSGSDSKKQGSDVQRSSAVIQKTTTDVKQSGSGSQETNADAQRSSLVIQQSSSGSQKTNGDVQRSSLVIQKTTTDVQQSGSGSQKTNGDVQRSSIVVENTTTEQKQSGSDSKRSSVDVQMSGTNVRKSSVDVQKSNANIQLSRNESQKSRNSEQSSSGSLYKSSNGVQENGVQISSNGVQNSSNGDQKSSTHVSEMNITSVTVTASENSEEPTQSTKQGKSETTAPPSSPVKSQRSPDSAYHSDAQSPGFDLGKIVAPSHSNVESRQEVTVQRAAIESQPAARPGESQWEGRGSFQSETLQTTGQSARDRAGGPSSSHQRDPGPPQDTSSPLPASYNTTNGLLTTRIQEDTGPLRPSPRENSTSHGTLRTEIISNNTSQYSQVRGSTEEQDGKFSVHIQPAQGPQRITVSGSQHSPAYSNNSYSPYQQENYSSLPRSEASYNYRQGSSSARYYTNHSPGPSSRLGHQGHPYRHQQGPSGPPGSRVVPLQPVSVDISLADRYSPRSPSNRHLQTIHGMSAMAGEVMQPFNLISSGGGRHFDYSDGRYVAEQVNFSSYERSSGTKHYNDHGLHVPEMDRNSSIAYSSQNFNSNAPKRKYLKVDESRSNGRVPMYNGDLESYEYHQHSNRSPRYRINTSRTTDDVFEDESIHSEPGYRHHRHGGGGGGGMHMRRVQKHSAMSRSQPHLNEIGQPNSLGEPLYVSVPHSPPRYGTLRSARSETMLAQQSPSGGDSTLLLPHLEDAKSKQRAKYPYHITLKLNQLAGSRPGSSSHMSLQRSSRDGYYNSWQSERQQTQSLSGINGSGGKKPMHTSSVSLVNIELDPRSPTGQQPARYREDGSYSRQEKYSYQHQQQQLQHQLQLQQQNQQQQDAYVFTGSYPSSHVESTQVIHTNGSPQRMGEKEFFLDIANLPENERNNNNYILKSSNQTNERVTKKQTKQQQQNFSGKDPDFTMAINQTMTMDYLPKQKKKREEPPRQQNVRQRRYVQEEMENYLSPEEEDDRYYNEIPRIERGSYLIKNSIDTTSAPQHFDVVETDDLDESFAVEENTNLFDRKYVTRRDNPGYVSDEEEEVYIEKKHRKPAFTNIFETTETTTRAEEDVVDIPVSYTNSYETSYSKQGGSSLHSKRSGSSNFEMKRAAKKPAQRMDRTDYEERVTTSSYQKSAPRMQTTHERVEITEHDLERLLKGAPPGSVKQTINVEREEEEILGPLPITQADGEESAAEGLLNFDTVSEKVELGIVNGKAQLTVKVRCERVVPIRGVDDMFKKSSVIVTRLIDIDMAATNERRHLLENIMAGASKRTLNESTGHVRHSSQKMLNTKDTFQLYKTFMAMAEAEEGRNTTGQMHVEKRLEDERGLPDHAEFDIRTEDVDETVFGEPVEMEFDTDDLERRLESQMMSNGITNGTRLEAMPNGRGHVIKGQDPDTISYRSAASDNSGIIY